MSNNSIRVYYGLSLEPNGSIDVTEKILQQESPFYLGHHNTNQLFSDPFPNQAKKLVIKCSNGQIHVFNEYNGTLQPQIGHFCVIDRQLEYVPTVPTPISTSNTTTNLVRYRSKPRVYIISNVDGGGCLKYLNDLIRHYQCEFVYIRSKSGINQADYCDNDILFMQHFILTDLTPTDILSIKQKTQCKLIVSLHDFSYFMPVYQNQHGDVNHSKYLETDVTPDPNVKQLIEQSDATICPSRFIYDQFSRYFNPKSLQYVAHNDIRIETGLRGIPAIQNRINVGILSVLSVYKGCEFIKYLVDKYSVYKDYQINFVIAGKTIPCYHDDDFYQVIKRENIHCLAYLNKWGESYCYCLSKGLSSGLPMIYNNFGAFRERISQQTGYFPAFDNERDCSDLNHLSTVFENLLDYVVNNQSQPSSPADLTVPINCLEIQYQPFYDNLFTIKVNVVCVTAGRQRNQHSRHLAGLEKTITSLRRYVPNCYLILIDNSLFQPSEVNLLTAKVNLLVNPVNDVKLTQLTDFRQRDQQFETVTRIESALLRHLQVVIPAIADNLFKISANCQVNHNFDYSKYDNDHNIFKFHTNQKSHYQEFYKIGKPYLTRFLETFDSQLEFNLTEFVTLGITDSLGNEI
jgi:hypothetical protein